jgi:hypothetical protein
LIGDTSSDIPVERKVPVRIVEVPVNNHVDPGVDSVDPARGARTVCRRQAVGRVRRLDGRSELVDGKGRPVWQGIGDPTSGGHELDPVGALLDHLAHRLAQAIYTIGLTAERPAMPTNHGRYAGLERNPCVLGRAEQEHVVPSAAAPSMFVPSPGRLRWLWQLTSPGTSVWLANSSVSAPSGLATWASGPIAMIRSASIRIAAFFERLRPGAVDQKSCANPFHSR